MRKQEFFLLGGAAEAPACLLPQMLSSVQAGFASAADEHIEHFLDLNELVVQHRAATFFVRVQGDSMKDEQIRSGDILVVDRALKPCHGKIVVAIINGEFTVKKLHVDATGIYLEPANPRYTRQKIDSEADFRIWGVVTYVVGAR